MHKLIPIIGMPGTGKTTLMRRWMKTRKWHQETPVKLLDSYVSDDGTIRLFGKYDDEETFAGTDRLSMAVQPVVIDYLKSYPNDVIIFEGDRLTSVSLFKEALKLGYDLNIIILNVDDEIREQRYKERGSEQSEKFIEGRRTKIENIKNEFEEKILTGDPCYYTIFRNETEKQAGWICSCIDDIISGDI